MTPSLRSLGALAALIVAAAPAPIDGRDRGDLLALTDLIQAIVERW